MHLKMPLLSQGVKLSNTESACRVAALHLFVEFITPMAFWLRAHSVECFFTLLFQD